MARCQEFEPDRPATIPAKSCSRRRRACSRNRASAAPASKPSRPRPASRAAQSIRRLHDLLDRHKSLPDFIEALKTMDRGQQDPLGRSPLLHMEMILFVARGEKRRPELAKRLRARRKLIADIVETTAMNSGRNPGRDPAWWVPIVLALEGGLNLHRLISPDTTPAESFLRAIGRPQPRIRTRAA